MENNWNTAMNSERISLDDNRQAILFKTSWLYNEIGLQKFLAPYVAIP